MAHARSRAWRRAQAHRKNGQKTQTQKTAFGLKFSRKLMWRRRDKLVLRCKEGYAALNDDWE